PSLLSTSFVPRQNPLTVIVWILDDDIYARPNKLCVQLWTNLIAQTWSSIDIDEEQQNKVIGCDPSESYRVFKIIISTTDIEEGWYEFTVRIKREGWNDWRWMSTDEGQNAKVFISKTADDLNHKKDLNNSVFYEKIDEEKIRYSLQGNVDCWCISSNVKSNSGLPIRINFGGIRNLVQYVVLQRLSAWWMIPVTGISKLDIKHKDILYILIQQSSGHYISLVPMASDGCICSFRSDENGGLILFVINDNERDSHARFVVGRGNDPYITTKACMKYINEINGNYDVEENNGIETEEHFDYDQIGFCTYNAHTLWGYWNGVDPNSELSDSYRIERVKHSNEIIHIVIPQDIQKFYNDFYSYLKSQ
ncbi:14759_t:CDS:2, partial [Dentiscutata heterogama]